MTITLILLAGAVALELLVHLFSKHRTVRAILAVLALIANAAVAGALIMIELNLFSAMVVIFTLYRIFNLIRIVEARMHERYLRIATRRTSFILLALQAVSLATWLAWETWHVTGHAVWAAISLLQLVVAGILLASTVRNLVRTAWPVKHSSYSDKELPTVTVAIPARNETEDLQQCLQSIIASDYPKLEVIVLDDCSQTKRTPEIIREFAHAGVRFVQGHQPADTWLPKNQAYAKLADEASGSYILFCGVDIRFEQHSIRTLISTMLDRDKQMMGILPQRQHIAYGHFSLIQAMRYWWELVPPRRTFNRPPVLSSCWVINHTALEKTGGFAAVSRAIVPEAYFARQLIQTDSYSFLRGGEALGIESNKHVSHQRDTAIRMRYPQMHRRPEQVALVALFEAIFLLLPFSLAIAGFWVSIGAVAHSAAVVASVMLVLTYELAVISTRVNTWWFGLIAQPLTALTDLALLHYSMWKYEFSTVDWKGRNVCIPVMHVVPNLPKSDQTK